MAQGLHGFIKDWCCNYQGDSCLGINIMANSEGKHTCFNNTGKCLVMENKPCGFFERAVIANATQPIVTAYSKVSKKVFLAKTRLCKCGKPLAPKKQFCIDCFKKRYRDSQRIYAAERRKNQRRISVEKVPSQVVVNKEVTKAVFKDSMQIALKS